MLDLDKLKRTLLRIVGCLAHGEYEAVEKFTGGKNLSRDELRKIIEEWHSKLVMPPSESLTDLVYGEPVTVKGEFPCRWAVYGKLWTEMEGWSDLSLVLTVVDNADPEYTVEIDSIRVL